MHAEPRTDTPLSKNSAFSKNSTSDSSLASRLSPTELNSRYFDGRWEVTVTTDPTQRDSTIEIERTSEQEFCLRECGRCEQQLTWRERDQLLVDGTGSVTVALWNRSDYDGLLVLRESEGCPTLTGARRMARNPVFDPRNFFLDKTFTVFGEALGQTTEPNPRKTKVRFSVEEDPTIFRIHADEHIKPYDRLVFNPATSSLDSLYGWRSIAFLEGKPNRIFAMFDAGSILEAKGHGHCLARLMPHEAAWLDEPELTGTLADNIAIWGADDG